MIFLEAVVTKSQGFRDRDLVFKVCRLGFTKDAVMDVR